MFVFQAESTITSYVNINRLLSLQDGNGQKLLHEINI